MTPLHWSDLKHMGLSPAHYRYAIDHPKEQTAAMRNGSLVDWLIQGCSVIGPEQSTLFEIDPAPFVVWPHPRRGKPWTEFQEANQGSTIIRDTELENALEVVDQIKAAEFAWEIIDGTDQQVPLAWDMAGRHCATRGMDFYCEGVMLADLKVLSSPVPPGRMPWHARNQGWFGQLGFYLTGLEVLGHPEPTHVAIIAAEWSAPHVVTVYHLSETAREFGKRSARSLFEHLRVCEESDNWPGYSQGIEVLNAPEDDLTLTIDGEEFTL